TVAHQKRWCLDIAGLGHSYENKLTEHDHNADDEGPREGLYWGGPCTGTEEKGQSTSQHGKLDDQGFRNLAVIHIHAGQRPHDGSDQTYADGMAKALRAHQ